MEKFSPVGEKEITRAIVTEFTQQFHEYVESDCIIIGAGPSGLVAGRNIAKAGKKVLIVERNNYLGGGFWIGGYLMNKVTVRHPGERLFDEIGVPYKSAGDGLVVADAPHACARLIASACDAGAKIANMTMLEDLVVKEGRVCGAVINWAPISHLPREICCLDPVAIEAPVVIDATGHASEICHIVVDKLHGKLNTKGGGILGEKSMWADVAEKQIMENTKEVYPGLIVAGMAANAVYGTHRMGPVFGGMLLSGKRAAEVALERLR